jgi:hypothetical protein
VRGVGWAERQIYKTNQQIVGKFINDLNQYIESKFDKKDQEYAKQKIQSWLQKGSNVDPERDAVGQLGTLQSAGGRVLDAKVLLSAFEEINSQLEGKVARHNTKESKKLDELAESVFAQDPHFSTTDELIERSIALTQREDELEKALAPIPIQGQQRLENLINIQKVLNRHVDRERQINLSGSYDRESEFQAKLQPLIAGQLDLQNVNAFDISHSIEQLQEEIATAKAALPYQLSQLEARYEGEDEIPLEDDEKISSLRRQIADAQHALRNNQNALAKIRQAVQSNAIRGDAIAVTLTTNKASLFTRGK